MKLSIITINYNNKVGLNKTIESVINQKQSYFEYIVIDGGSNDGSKEIIEKYKDNIDYWVSEPDKGIYNAMNKGIQVAKGEYLLFMNSGDEINPDVNFKSTINKLSTNEDIFIFDTEIRGENLIYTRTYPEKIDYIYLLYCSITHQGTIIKRKKLVEYGGYDERRKITADWTYFLDAICFENQSYRYIAESFSIYYLDGISSSPENAKAMMFEQRQHVKEKHPQFYTIFETLDELAIKKETINRFKKSKAIGLLKKIGFLRWFDLTSY